MAGGWLKRTLLDRFLGPILRPLTRMFIGLVAVPIYRQVRRRIPGVAQFDDEVEKDLEQWFRGSLLLLLATKNFEMWVASRLNPRVPDWLDLEMTGENWLLAGGRLLLAIAVIEAMPDQELFAIIHPGPPDLKLDRKRSLWGNIQTQAWPYIRGVSLQLLNRAAPVLAIMAVIFGGMEGTPRTVGWVCYVLAIAGYLIIGLITSRDKMLDVLSRFDRQIALRRRELIEEFDIDESVTSAPLGGSSELPTDISHRSVASASGAQYDSTMQTPSEPSATGERQADGRQEADAP